MMISTETCDVTDNAVYLTINVTCGKSTQEWYVGYNDACKTWHVLNRNASSRRNRLGFGKTFNTFADAFAAYKSEKAHAALTTAREIVFEAFPRR